MEKSQHQGVGLPALLGLLNAVLLAGSLTVVVVGQAREELAARREVVERSLAAGGRIGTPFDVRDGSRNRAVFQTPAGQSGWHHPPIGQGCLKLRRSSL